MNLFSTYLRSKWAIHGLMATILVLVLFLSVYISGSWFFSLGFFNLTFLTYINLYVLIPLFLLSNKYLHYLLALLLSCFLFSYPGFVLIVKPALGIPQVVVCVALCLLLQLIPAAVKLIQSESTNRFRIAELEQSQLKAELELLKSQINPHFFFNAMNSLYSMALTKDERVGGIILKLSNLVRFVLASGEKNLIFLKNETDHIADYLELEKMRLNSGTIVEFNCQGDLSEKTISPLLLLPFVENAFKHGGGYDGHAMKVQVDLSLQPDGLFFEVCNSKSVNSSTLPSTKLGLKNIRRRLELLYPQKHELLIKDELYEYKVSLWIKNEL